MMAAISPFDGFAVLFFFYLFVREVSVDQTHKNLLLESLKLLTNVHKCCEFDMSRI
jgi:hypothetical protein